MTMTDEFVRTAHVNRINLIYSGHKSFDNVICWLLIEISHFDILNENSLLDL